MGTFKMEWRIGEEMCEWVGRSSPFFVNNNFLVAWEFELLLQKKEETLEHYGS
jgi:hypothetical protein